MIRILAALAAVALYLVFWWLVEIGWLLFAWWRGYQIPGYHEPGMDAWWGWLIYAAWWVGLVAVAWWAGFRAPWWHRGQGVQVTTEPGTDLE